MPPDWAREYFERGYAQRWGLQAPSDQVRLDAGGLWSLLQLSPGSGVIDIGCGHGRYALALAEQGADVIGLDFSDTLLRCAGRLGAESRPGVRLIRGDMLQLPCRSESARGAILLDAFGFFETDDQDQAVLREIARVVTAGGRLALKVANGRPVLDAFRETDREERDGKVISIARTLTLDPPRMTERIRISEKGGDTEYERRQRLYRIEECRAALETAGFSFLNVFAHPDRTPFDPELSSAMWIVCERAQR
jgi:SAM-dependent methyltransferase